MMRLLASLLFFCCVGSLCAAPAPVTNLSDAQRMEILERRVSKLTELTLRLDALEQENSQLRGDVETLNHRIRQMQRKQRDIYADIDQRLGSLSNKPTLPAAPVVPPVSQSQTSAPKVEKSPAQKPAQPAQQPTAVAASDPAKIRAEYDAAYLLLSPAQRQYLQAIAGFKAFLAKYPQDLLAANAQYWLAEAYYVTQDNVSALAAFKQVINQYPNSAKVAGAWYKVGRIEQASRRYEAATTAYQAVVQRYPQSSAAGLAQKALTGLRSQKN